jgi:hypothetical protein
MKKVFEKMFFVVLTIVLLSAGSPDKNAESELQLYSLLSPQVDTNNLFRMISVDPFMLTILPPSSGVQFYKDGIVFLSLSKYEKEMSPQQISFGTEEAYYAFVNDTLLGRHNVFSSTSFFPYPCEAITFSHDYNYIYYTEIPKKEKKEKIFRAKLSQNSKNQQELIPDIAPLDFCKGNYSYSHPSLSSDDKMLVFASDMEGSLGGMDLFVTRWIDGKWSVPENLGKNINTSGNEFFPFLDLDNNLFFSSDGLHGYGGYDIFTCKFKGSGWDKPVNLTDQVNSRNDDIAFTINKTDGKTAFFSRRQKSGKTDIQLFRVSLKKEAAKMKVLTLSSVFNGKPASVTNFIAASTETKASQKDSINTKPKAEVLYKEEPKVQEKTAVLKKTPDNVARTKAVPAGKPSESTVQTRKPVSSTSEEQNDVVIYRIQLFSTSKQKKEKEIDLAGKSYTLFEYSYLGSYRYTIGEFKSLPPAIQLQRTLRQSGYPQAFIVAFKNNTRSLDPKLFK